MSFISFWTLVVVATAVIARIKNRTIVGWFFLGLVTGPVALLFIILLPTRVPSSHAPQTLSNSITLEVLQKELNEIQERCSNLAENVTQLKNKINTLQSNRILDNPAPPQVKVVTEKIAEKQVLSKKDLESDIGKFWLNKIGIVILAFGIAFLIAQAFTYFGAFAKIACGYLISAILFFSGFHFQKKERFLNYAKVLLGGAWAITYLTTYAMYHFEASRIISSQMLDLFLLALVAGGIIAHSLKYKSQVLCAMALSVGYLTASISNVNLFTFFSCLVLAAVVLVLVYKMQWVRLIFAGIAFTYLAHLLWLTKHINVVWTWNVFLGGGYLHAYPDEFALNSIFLWLYWILFTVSIHITKCDRLETANKLSAANFCNFLFLFAIYFPQLVTHYPEQKFTFMLFFSAVYFTLFLISRRSENKPVSDSSLIVSISLLTFAIPMKYMPFETSLIWLVEMPFLMFVGLRFKHTVTRYLGFALACVLFIKFIGNDIFLTEPLDFFVVPWAHRVCIAFLGFLFAGASFFIAHRASTQDLCRETEKSLLNVFSALSVAYLTSFVCWIADPRFITLFLTGETILIFMGSLYLKDHCLKAYFLCIYALVTIRFCFIDGFDVIGHFAQWNIIIGILLCVFSQYAAYRHFSKKEKFGENEYYLVNFCFVSALIMMLSAIYRYIPHFWTSLFLGLAGGGLVSAGFITKDKVFRIGGFLVFALTLFRVVFVDLSGLSTLYKITSFVILGLLFLVISFIYNRYNLSQTQEKK